ncbi:MAG TPA: TonB-dependent receptor, partial [Terriglobia bacterium]|nr:TonB-dependent receptor [Terriglobia bacterium]
MWRMAFAALWILAGVSAGFPQSQMSSGDIKGTVTDLQGGSLSGATIRLKNIETGLTRQATTDMSGDWHFFVVPPGAYEVRAEQPGFVAMTRLPIHVTVGATIDVDLRLEIAGASSEVLVQADSPILEIEKTQQSDTITEERIDNLPINQRNYLGYSMLTSGVTDSAGLNTFSLPQAPTSNLSFLGQNGRSNSVTIDGVDNNDAAVGAERSTVSQDAVQEFQINRSNFSAEFGRASGGLINIVSKSGTNDWHGTLFSYFRNQALDARNPFAFGPNGSPTDPPYSRWQAGFAFGGPIKSDRTFYFLSYEGLRQRESRFVTFMENTAAFQPSASQAALIDALTATGNPSFVGLGNQLRSALTTSSTVYPDTLKLLEANSGVFPFKSNNNTASLRLDHSWSASNQLFARLTFTDTDTVGGSFGGLKAPSRAANYKIQDYAIAAGDTAYFGSSRVNEFRFQFANRDYDTLPADPIGPEITINGLVGLGRDFYLPSLRNEKRVQLLDNFTIALGKHVLKFGGDANIVPIDTTTEVFFGGRFIFGEAVPLASIIDSAAGAGTSSAIATALPSYVANLAAPVSSLQSFNFGLPIVYQQGFGDPRATLSNTQLSGYVQDRYRAADKVTFDFGLRYDVELQPTPIHRDTNNFAPRFGFTYTPASKLLIRGGYGIYYAPVYEALGFIGRVLNGQQISQIFVPLTGLPA